MPTKRRPTPDECPAEGISRLHTHLTLRSVAKRSVSKDGNAKDGAAAIMRCVGIGPVATKARGLPRAIRDTALRSIPQSEVGVSLVRKDAPRAAPQYRIRAKLAPMSGAPSYSMRQLIDA